MRTRTSRFIRRFGSMIVLTLGLVVFSQGVSFGRWSSFATAAENHDLHALLLTFAGVSLFLAGLLFHQVLQRLDAAERQLDTTADPPKA